MHLFNDLIKEGYQVGLGLSSKEFTGPCFVVQLTGPTGNTVQMSQTLYQDLDIKAALAKLCRKHFSSSVAYAEWKKSQGQVPVKLLPGALAELGCAVHTSLRKNVDTLNSAIAYNAIRELGREDLTVLWGACETLLVQLFKDEAHPTRAEVATEFARTVDDTVYALLDKRVDGESKENAVRDLALRMLSISIKMTTPAEWMWGWLGFVLEPLGA